MSAPVTVTREDAIKFCNRAMRNWQYVSFDEDELEDLRVELERHRQQAEAASKAREDALVEALGNLANAARATPRFASPMLLAEADKALARAKASSDGGEG